jgi:hypothetical protein
VETPQGRKNLVFTVGIDDTIYAVDADAGGIVWQKSFPNTGKALRPANTNCADTEQATPVIDRQAGVIYFTTSDGKLRGLSLASGEEKLAPTPFVAPFSRNWSLNLVKGVIYTAAAPLDPGDAADLWPVRWAFMFRPPTAIMILPAGCSAMRCWRSSPGPMASPTPSRRRAGRISTPRISTWAQAVR